MKYLVLVLALCGFVACNNESPSSPASSSIGGVYRLKKINGSNLPYVIQSGSTKITVKSDVITVADGGTWSEQGAYTLEVNGNPENQVIADGGTWARNGTSITFISSYDNRAAYSGTFDGSSFNLYDEDFTYVFSK